jgi:hypothetical protein
MFNGVGTHHGRDELVGVEAGYNGALGVKGCHSACGGLVSGSRSRASAPGLASGIREPVLNIGRPGAGAMMTRKEMTRR